jgi:predicted aspartyl protease
VAATRRDRIGRIWAPVLINNQGPFRLVLDTGASHSALIASTAMKLALLPGVSQRLYGVTGTAMVPSVHVETMEVGDLLLASTDLPIVADVFGGAEGVVGREALPNKRIMADFVHDRLVIGLSHGERAPPGFMTIHLQLTGIGLLAVNTRVGGVPAKAIIDTGAQSTIGNLALRDALMRHPPKDGAHKTDIVGVTLDVQTADNLPSPPLTLGPMRLEGLAVSFGDMSLFEHWQLTREPVLLIGMDVLGLMDVLVIDYHLREMQVRLHNATPSAPTFVDGHGRRLDY